MMPLNPSIYFKAAWPRLFQTPAGAGSNSAAWAIPIVRAKHPIQEPSSTPSVEPTGLADWLREAASQLRHWNDMPQNPITFMAPLNPKKEATLRALLNRIDQDTHHSAILPFAKFDERLHFARLLILEGPDHPQEYGSSLIFLANVDGRVDDFLQQMNAAAASGLDRLLECCRDYPAKARRTPESRLAYLKRHLIPAQAYYINTIGRSARQIHQEDALYQALQGFLNQLDPAAYSSAKEIRQAVIGHLKASPELSWALAPREQPGLLWRLKEGVRFAALATLGGVILFWSWPLLTIWVVNLQRKEMGDQEYRHRPPLSRLIQLRDREDVFVHNQFSAVGFVKPGWVRRTNARAILAAAQVVLRHVFNKGNLAGIPLLGLDGVDTIHFARWIMLDDDRRLLFASNYDGSLESYMVDFIDKVAWGLNIVFSNGVGYPRTNWLVQGGARNEQRFKDYLGLHQIETQVWHAPYPHLTAVNIANNEAVREGLQGSMNEKQARAWLKRFGQSASVLTH